MLKHGDLVKVNEGDNGRYDKGDMCRLIAFDNKSGWIVDFSNLGNDHVYGSGEHWIKENIMVPVEMNIVTNIELRDKFAMQALNCVPDYLKELQTDQRIKIAEWCYGMADAMIHVREVNNGRS